MCIGVLPECILVCHMHAAPMEAEEGVGSPGTGVTDGYEPPYGCWELNQDLLEEQPVLLTAEPSGVYV